MLFILTWYNWQIKMHLQRERETDKIPVSTYTSSGYLVHLLYSTHTYIHTFFTGFFFCSWYISDGPQNIMKFLLYINFTKQKQKVNFDGNMYTNDLESMT